MQFNAILQPDYTCPGLNQLAHQITQWRDSKGFATPTSLGGEMMAKLMLVVSEVSEAAEACRDLNSANFKEEIADTFIRLLDICGAMDIDIEQEIHNKMIKNLDRPYLHGRTC